MPEPTQKDYQTAFDLFNDLPITSVTGDAAMVKRIAQALAAAREEGRKDAHGDAALAGVGRMATAILVAQKAERERILERLRAADGVRDDLLAQHPDFYAGEVSERTWWLAQLDEIEKDGAA